MQEGDNIEAISSSTSVMLTTGCLRIGGKLDDTIFWKFSMLQSEEAFLQFDQVLVCVLVSHYENTVT